MSHMKRNVLYLTSSLFFHFPKLDGRTASDTSSDYRGSVPSAHFTQDRFQRTLIRLSPASLTEVTPLCSCGRQTCIWGESWFCVYFGV